MFHFGAGLGRCERSSDRSNETLPFGQILLSELFSEQKLERFGSQTA
jgi:hypothetical protein